MSSLKDIRIFNVYKASTGHMIEANRSLVSAKNVAKTCMHGSAFDRRRISEKSSLGWFQCRMIIWMASGWCRGIEKNYETWKHIFASTRTAKHENVTGALSSYTAYRLPHPVLYRPRIVGHELFYGSWVRHIILETRGIIGARPMSFR